MSSQCTPGRSAWETLDVVDQHVNLKEDAWADVCVIGAGIAGLTTAYLLACEGRSVIVVDAGEGGGGETRYTTAHLASVLDDRFCEVEHIHGEAGIRVAAESHAAAIDRIEMITKTEFLDCDFKRVNGFLIEGAGRVREFLAREMDAARRAGLEVEMLQRTPWPDFAAGPCLHFPRQGQFHPLKYLHGLTRVIKARGGKIYTHTHVDEVIGGEPAHVHVDEGKRVTCQAVVVATNTPINDIVTVHTKQAPYMTYAFAAEIPRGYLPQALYWDTLDPYHYVRLQPSNSETHELIIVGGEDHKTGQATDQAERYTRLEAWARERFPAMGKRLHCWSGQVMETIDGLGFIGRNPGDIPNVFIATGDSGMGMTHGTIAGMLITDLIMGRANRWEKLYDPGRMPVRAAWDYAKENLNVAAQYADWVTGGDVGNVDQIKRDSGAVVRRGLHKVAAYRDEHGTLHECSAACPHLGCIVHWNNAEKTWDCPCHGSRFSKEGKVLHGPAISDLGVIDDHNAAVAGSTKGEET